MNRRTFLHLAGWAPGIFTAAWLNGNQNSRRRPNIVFFLIDDMGWKDLGCYGSAFLLTPNIDRLAGEGGRFTDAYAACPVCSPSRASIMTGKHPARLGITDWIGASQHPTPYSDYLPLGETTIAEALKEAGYATGFVGKWHLSTAGEDRSLYYPERQGFDLNVGGDHSGSPPTYFHPYSKNGRSLERMPPGGQAGEYLTDRLTEESLRFIETNKDRPFLLFLSHYAVHRPIEAKKELIDKHRARADALRQGVEPRFKPVYGSFQTRQVQDDPAYAGMVESVDESVGKILGKIAELGLEAETIVFFMSDNGGLSTVRGGGPTCNLPLRAGKGWLYEGGIREPMIVKWPGVLRPGTVIREPAVSTDFFPTILEMCGLDLKPEQHLDGESFAPILRGGETRAPRVLYWHYPHYHGSGNRPSGAIRAGNFKLIEWYEDRRVELYNLKEDLGEQKDLANTMPEKAAELRQMLHSWRREIGARMPEGPPRDDYELFLKGQPSN